MNRDRNFHLYDDIINLPHHVSKKHPRMDLVDRAAQFSPFAALTGYESAIKETARLTDNQADLDENNFELMDRKLQIIKEKLSEKPFVTFVCFEPDKRKQGGSYETITGVVKKIDEYRRKITLEDGREILFDFIIEIDSRICEGLM